MNNNITISLKDAENILYLADQGLKMEEEIVRDSPDDPLSPAREAVAKLRRKVAKKDIHQQHDKIIEWAKRFSEPNDPRPIVKDFVIYYQVGRNSTHSFYVGIDFCKGKLYRASWDGYEDDTEFGGEWHVSEKESLESFANDYMGHY